MDSILKVKVRGGRGRLVFQNIIRCSLFSQPSEVLQPSLMLRCVIVNLSAKQKFGLRSSTSRPNYLQNLVL